MIERFRRRPIEQAQPHELTQAEKTEKQIAEIHALLTTIEKIREDFCREVEADSAAGIIVPEASSAFGRMSELAMSATALVRGFVEQAGVLGKSLSQRLSDVMRTSYDLSSDVNRKSRALISQGRLREALEQLRRGPKDDFGVPENIVEHAVQTILTDLSAPSKDQKVPYLLFCFRTLQALTEVAPEQREIISTELLKDTRFPSLAEHSADPLRLLEVMQQRGIDEAKQMQIIQLIDNGQVSERFITDEPDTRCIDYIIAGDLARRGVANYDYAKPFIEAMMRDLPAVYTNTFLLKIGNVDRLYGDFIARTEHVYFLDTSSAKDSRDFYTNTAVIGHLALLVGKEAVAETWHHLSIDTGIALLEKAPYPAMWVSFFSTIFEQIADKDQFLAQALMNAPVQDLFKLDRNYWNLMPPELKHALFETPNLLNVVLSQPMDDQRYRNCLHTMAAEDSPIDMTQLIQKILQYLPEKESIDIFPKNIQKSIICNPVFLQRYIQKMRWLSISHIIDLSAIFEGDRSVFRRIVLSHPSASTLAKQHSFSTLPEDIKTEIFRRELGERTLSHLPFNEGVEQETIESFFQGTYRYRGIKEWVDRLEFLWSAHEIGNDQSVVIEEALSVVSGDELRVALERDDLWTRLPVAMRESPVFWKKILDFKGFAAFRQYREKIPEVVEGFPFMREGIAYCDATAVDDPVVYQSFIDYYRLGGAEVARAYLDELRETAKGLIGGPDIKKLRARSEYLYLTKLVFADGNYSSYEKNIASGDKTQHLDQYTFDRAGYPVQMSGLMGYRFKSEGARDNIDLYKGYEHRLQKVRDFVGQRGPDNTALQAAFEKEVNQLFDEHANKAFQGLKGLSVKEKMLALLITQTLPGVRLNADILDLVVKFKYAYHENLEEYVQLSAQEVEQYTDEVSQRFVSWNELGTIYGENVKHVMQHSIFEELAGESAQYQVLVDIFGDLIGSKREVATITPRQEARIRNTCENDKIDAQRKFPLLRDQAMNMFATNIRFDPASMRAEFETELDVIVEPLRDTPTVEAFLACVPALFRLRDRYRFGINAKLEEYIMRDYNLITAEMAKFEEIVEVEAKETTMGGAREKEVKKSTKKRNIRGFFMKSQETTNARMGAYICIAGDMAMWENPNYFEFVEKDEDTGKCVGVAMLLHIEAVDGKRYLSFGPNPFESFLTQVRSEQAFNHMYQQVTQFAAENGYDGVVVPSAENKILGSCTNRGGNFPDLIKAKRLRKKDGGLRVVDFGAEHVLGHYGNSAYSYADGALIWEPGPVVSTKKSA